MKKIYLSLIALLGAISFCNAQWTTSASNIYNSNTGNVGIGITSPGSKLDIANILSGAHSVNSSLFRVQDLYNGGSNGQYFQIIGAGDGTNYTNVNLISNYGYLSLGARADANATATNSLNIFSNGNIGIGTTTPAQTLDIAGTLGVSSLVTSTVGSGEVFRNLSGNTNPLTFRLKNTGNDFYIGTEGAAAGGYFTGSLPYSSVIYSSTPIQNIVGGVARTIIDGSGNFGVNTTDTHGYKFAVNGSAIATSMTVKLYANWPDYVFKKDYRLSSLADVKKYINANHRLPGMPSEQQIAKDGLNLGEMNKLLTKKVEELTLYMIDKEEKQKKQEKTIRDLNARLSNLEKILENSPQNNPVTTK